MGGPRRECPTLLGPKAMLVQGDPKYPCLELTLTSTAVSGQFNERNMVNVGVVVCQRFADQVSSGAATYYRCGRG